jgi:hypothetical protein
MLLGTTDASVHDRQIPFRGPRPRRDAGMSPTVIALVDLGLDPAIHHAQKQSASWKHVGLGVNPADDM